jgi:hypothetical protein
MSAPIEGDLTSRASLGSKVQTILMVTASTGIELKVMPLSALRPNKAKPAPTRQHKCLGDC